MPQEPADGGTDGPATAPCRANARLERDRAYLVFCLLLLTAGAAGHIAYLVNDCPLDLAGDEAHYWEWARRPALSYYSKGPLVAWIIAGSRALLGAWSCRVVGTEMLAVRLPAVGLSVLTGLGIYVLSRTTPGRPQAALAAVAITFTVPIFAVGALLMTIDAPFVCAWTWALVAFVHASRRESLPAWILGGLLIAVGILAKYTMVLMYPVAGLALLATRAVRRRLMRPGPCLAALLGLAGFVPIVLWNAAHDWVSFRHVAGQAGLGGTSGFDPLGPLIYLGGQLAVVGLWAVGMVWGAVDLWRRPVDQPFETHDAPAAIWLSSATLVPWLAFLPFSFITKIQPNWPVVSLVGGIVLLPLWLGRRLRLPAAGGRAGAKVFLAAAVLLGSAATLIMHRTDLLMPLWARLARDAAPWELTPVARYDPASRLRGWSQLGRAVGEVLAAERTAGRDPFIVADDYQLASQIAFYCPGQPTVYNIQSALGHRMNQYDLWENPVRDAVRFIGRPCLYVGSWRPRLTGEDGSPPALPGLRLVRTVEHVVGGQRVRVWSIFACASYAGFGGAPGGRHAF